MLRLAGRSAGGSAPLEGGGGCGGSGSGCGGSGCGGGGDGGRSLSGSAVAAVRQVRPCASPPDVTHDVTQMLSRRPQHFEHLFSDEVPSTQLPKLDLATQTILAEQEALRQQMGEASQM